MLYNDSSLLGVNRYVQPAAHLSDDHITAEGVVRCSLQHRFHLLCFLRRFAKINQSILF